MAEWINPIIDRTSSDIKKKTNKSYINYYDLNRIENNMKVLFELLQLSGSFKGNWSVKDIPLTSDRNNILSNLLIAYDDFIEKFPGAEIEDIPYKLNNYVDFNKLEKVQLDIYSNLQNRGLPPYGTNWNLYGVQPCEYQYLTPGIYLKGFSSDGAFMFTCAESPEKIDFTRVKSVRINYNGTYGTSGVSGGAAVIPVTHSTNPKSQILYTVLEHANPENTSVTLDCKGIGGQQILLLYSDLDYTLNITGLTIEHYPDSRIADISALTWEQRNYQYESDNFITCAAELPVPADVSEIAVHLSAYDSSALKSCVAFLDESKNVLSYGDGWQGTAPNGVAVSTHFQNIPENTAYLQIAAGRAPNMTSPFSPQDLEKCIVCFS